MRQWLPMRIADFLAQRPDGADEDVHFPESLVETVVGEYTSPGQRVLDPFAGFGTTLVVAERMGRDAVGVELLPERVELIRGRLAVRAEVVNGDARTLSSLVTGPFDLCFTSPPYMTVNDHPENPLNAYETDDGDYATYLDELGDVFGQVAGLLRPGGHAVVNVANVRTGGVFTPLAWDVARVVSRSLTLEQESFLCWDELPDDLSSDYCLVFRRPPSAGQESDDRME
jgi:DNA modification methylase